MSDVSILPCPFCGGPASLEQGGGYNNSTWSVGCDARNEDACPGHQSLTVFARQCDAIRAWNRREADARLATATAQIEALMAEVESYREALKVARLAFEKMMES